MRLVILLGDRNALVTLPQMNQAFMPEPVSLTGQHVCLEPLALHHAPALFAASQHEAIWRWLPIPMFGAQTEVEKWIAEALQTQTTGTEVAWAIVRKSDGLAVGSTRYLDIRPPHRTLEIGWTWLARAAQRTAITHAFETLGAVRVQLKTDERNEQSRAAIARLGAVFEGILRNYQTRAHDGYVRNTAMYSITAEEWPAVKARLAGDKVPAV